MTIETEMDRLKKTVSADSIMKTFFINLQAVLKNKMLIIGHISIIMMRTRKV